MYEEAVTWTCKNKPGSRHLGYYRLNGHRGKSLTAQYGRQRILKKDDTTLEKLSDRSITERKAHRHNGHAAIQ